MSVSTDLNLLSDILASVTTKLSEFTSNPQSIAKPCMLLQPSRYKNKECQCSEDIFKSKVRRSDYSYTSTFADI